MHNKAVLAGGVAVLLLLLPQTPSSASAQEAAAVPVTVTTFIRAETDRYFAAAVGRNGIGRMGHFRQMVSIAAQPVVRPNLDTLYSTGVFDLDAGPVTITLPDPGRRFMQLQAISEDHYIVGVHDAPGSYTFTREQAGTRYLMLALRTFADPRDPADLAAAHALQDAVATHQAGTGLFQTPNWEKASLDRLRETLSALMSGLDGDTGGFFGARGEVDPVLHLVATAALWGGNPREAAVYLNRFPPLNDGVTTYRLTVKDVPVDGFWSVSVYNARGYFEANARNAYAVNSVTARRDGRGEVQIQFGNCTDATPNCLPITPGWNYTVRLYRPHAEVLSGAWRFPDAIPVPGSVGLGRYR